MGARASARERASGELERRGILLHADATLPSVSSIVAGEPIRGSWWGHPKGHEIFAVLEAIADSGDATSAKLVNGKVTFVHRTIWAELYAVGSCDEDWQTRGLSSPARDVLAAVRQRGDLRTDELRAELPSYEQGAVRELERRLLVHCRQIHTDSGAHARILSTWNDWAEGESVNRQIGVAAAKEHFESIVGGWREALGAEAALPWS